jgi:hypothetical protein
LGGESAPAVGGVAGVGMNGLTRLSVAVGARAGLAGADEVVEAGGGAGTGAGGIAELAGGAEEVVEAGGGAGTGAGGIAELAGGAEEAVEAGGLAGVCAIAPETRKGSPTSAPTIQIRSIMQQDPSQRWTRFMRDPRPLCYSIKVTDWSPGPGCAALAPFFAYYAA